MIIVRMKGGLGNQMFQYAAGRSLALKTGLPLVLDLRHYNREHEHGYALGGLGLADISYDEARLPPSPRDSPLAYGLWRFARRKPQLLHENGACFDPAIAAVCGPAWIEGYFQSERYFAAHTEAIRSELTPTTPLDALNARWLAKIKADPCAVSVHVRRGDYVRNLKFAAHHGTCTPNYYARALDHVARQMGAEPVIYAFSDDPDWVRNNLQLPAQIKVVGHNDASRNVEDLRLMSACRHHIIANSSFSWWAAWLNPRADKIVAAPKVWFADPAFVNPDIWAEGWARIEG
tara:strand:- start:682 stop:1551 length:870 start_codon:yes stop_codon:yes gene_type:complete